MIWQILKEIQDRMRSIQDTLKITNAMYMISSSKLKKAKTNACRYRAVLFALCRSADRDVF